MKLFLSLTVALLFTIPSSEARTMRFPNVLGLDADDFHIEFESPVREKSREVTPPGRNGNRTFERSRPVDGNATNIFHFYDGLVRGSSEPDTEPNRFKLEVESKDGKP